MSDFTVKYIAHIDERKRPENFPKEIITIGVYRVEKAEQLKKIINDELGAIIQNQGMIVQLDPTAILDPEKVNTVGRAYVPMHLITYINCEIKAMSADMPMLADGKLVDSEGKPVVIN